MNVSNSKQWHQQYLAEYSVLIFSSPEPKAHKSELIVYQWLSIRPSVVYTFKLEYLSGKLANLDQIVCVASSRWGKGCISIWGRSNQNSGFHGNQMLPLTIDL